VTPRAGRDEVLGWRGDELAVRVRALPEDGQANAAVCRMVAKRLGVPSSSVSVVRGGTSRHKLLEVDGIQRSAIDEEFGSVQA
jgi:uncharacterized protein